MYAVYHGPGGLKKIALRVNGLAKTLAAGLKAQGFAVSSDPYFDTVKVEVADAAAVLKTAVEHGYNLRQLAPNAITVSLDETTTHEDVEAVLSAFGKHAKGKAPPVEQLAGGVTPGFEGALARTSTYMTQEVFLRYHTETEMMRYMFKLQSKDLGLNSSIIPLGSCTMKLNAAAEMIPVTWPEINNIHPFVPLDQVPGYQAMLQELGEWLIDITGFDAITLQPNAGAAGEYAGLMCIREYHKARGDGGKRNVCLIPRAAHGTNPATAAMCGMDVIPIECDDKVRARRGCARVYVFLADGIDAFSLPDSLVSPWSPPRSAPLNISRIIAGVRSECRLRPRLSFVHDAGDPPHSQGNTDMADLKEKATKYKDTLAALMITYPSTHGVFEDTIVEICKIVHDNGGLVYMDGANMNAQAPCRLPRRVRA